MRTYEWDKEVVPGRHGGRHAGAFARSHLARRLVGQHDKVYVQGDVTHVPYLFVRNPGWHAFYDQDAVMAEATRRKVYDMVVAEKMMVQGFHYPFPAHAYIEKTGNGYRESHGAVECVDLI